jgi:hypothetical protein
MKLTDPMLGRSRTTRYASAPVSPPYGAGLNFRIGFPEERNMSSLTSKALCNKELEPFLQK